MKKRIVMTMLAAMMVISGVTPVLAETTSTELDDIKTGGSAEVKSTFENAVYKVSITKELNTYLDPFQLLVADAHVTSDDFVIINKSSIPVAVDATIKVNGKSERNVTIKATADEVTEDTKDRLAYIEAQIPKTVTETDAEGTKYIDPATETAFNSLYYGGDNLKKYYTTEATTSVVEGEVAVDSEMIDTTAAAGVYATGDTKVAIDPTEGTTISFILDKAVYIPYYETHDATEKTGVTFKEVAADQKGTAAFRLGGTLNTEAEWEDGDIEGTVAYTFTGLSTGKYATKSDLVTDAGHAYIAGEEASPFASTTKGVIVGTEDLTIASVSAVTVNVAGKDQNMFAKNGTTWLQGTFAASTKTITLNAKALTYLTTNIQSDETVEATVTYKEVASGADKTAKVALKIR